jgi:hypothetical protein
MEKSQVVREERFKCVGCHGYINDVMNFEGIEFKDGDKKQPLCPECNIPMRPMCSQDHECRCPTTIHSGIRYCPECGEPVCPCGSSDVVGVSRVTGYLSDISGWGRGKQEELKDRNRYTI